MKTRILILGVSSFAGSSFAYFLSQYKQYQVFGTYNSKKNLKKLIISKSKNKIDFFQLDLSRDNNNLLDIVQKIKPRFIFDFASVCMVNESWYDPNYYFRVNVISKINLIKNLHKFKFLNKFIYISTPEIFGSTAYPVKENEKKFNPSTPYAVSKLTLEKLLINYNNSFAKKSIIARFTNFYGRGQLGHRLIPKLIYFIDNKKKFPLQGRGLSKRDFIFDEDFNNGLLKVMNLGKNGSIYHFSTNSYFTIRDVIKKICKLKGVKFKNVVQVVKDRVGKDKNYFLDNKKTSIELKWKPKNKLPVGLKKIIDYYS